MNILAIDPGHAYTAYARLSDGRPTSFGKMPNSDFLAGITRWYEYPSGVDIVRNGEPDVCVVEMIACYGMTVGREVFETCVMIGRIIERWSSLCDKPLRRITRPEVKLALCGTARAKDANVRAKLIDIYGPGKEVAIGRKASPGPLYGVSGDEWAALAVGVAWTQKGGMQ